MLQSFKLMITPLISAFTLMLMGSTNCYGQMIVKQKLSDNIDGIDGLDNPRQVKLSNPGSEVFVVSGDDNSLSVYALNNLHRLEFKQVFKDTNDRNLPLEGASDLVVLDKTEQVLVVSFYDGAMSVFDRTDEGLYQYSQLISDNLSYKRVFKDKEPIGQLDTFGLLGAWSIIKSADEKQVFVASYKSNAVSVFDVSVQKRLVLNQVLSAGNAHFNNIELGNPVSLALSPTNNELFVVGYEQHKLTIFSRQHTGELTLKQIISTDKGQSQTCLNPQKIVIQTDGDAVYLACAGSHTIAVYANQNQTYSLIQTVSNSDIGGFGLTGVGSMVLTPDRTKLFVAAEADSGLLLFNVMPSGKLELAQHYSVEEYGIEGVSSLALSADSQHLLMTLAKADSLLMLQL